MTCPWQREVPGVLTAVLLPLLACAPERDVVATEFASGGVGATSGPCATLAADPAPALVWFDFEDADGASQLTDVAQQRSASIVGAPGSVVPGPPGCGSALSFGNDERYMQLDDDPVWTLRQGSIDSWFWVPATIGDPLGVISRDQYGDGVGHFSTFILQDRTVMARLQQSDIGAPVPIVTLGCSSDPLPPSSWAHFGFNFGPGGAALYVNGMLAMRTGTPGLEVGMVTCGASSQDPELPDLSLPWVIGASIYASMDPPNVRQLPFLGGAIDNLRISAVKRDFVSAF